MKNIFGILVCVLLAITIGSSVKANVSQLHGWKCPPGTVIADGCTANHGRNCCMSTTNPQNGLIPMVHFWGKCPPGTELIDGCKGHKCCGHPKTNT